MVAIVTDDLKKVVVSELIADVGDSASNYYIGIGKSDQWNITDTPPTPVPTDREERDFRANLQSVIKTTDVSYVAPRYNWASGTTYQAYSDEKTATGTSANGQYYVMTASNRVYICLQQGKDATGTPQPSSVDPDTTLTTTNPGVATADGYIWKYLYTQSALRLSKFGSANFIPVEFVGSGVLTSIETAQQNVQNAAIPGSIIGYKVVSPGSGYAVSDTVTIQGNGSFARAKLTADPVSGVIRKVEIDDSTAIPVGSGYNFANVKINTSTGTGAVIRPIISKKGIGADAREDLRSRSLMFNAKIVGEAGDGDFVINNDFRQVGLIRNPTVPTSRAPANGAADSDFTATTGSALRILTLDSAITTGIEADDLLVGDNTGAKAYVDKVNGPQISYHQNDNTGYLAFSSADVAINDSLGTRTAAAFVSDSDGEVNPFSGEVLYIENRAAILRSSVGTEDIKMIVQF